MLTSRRFPRDVPEVPRARHFVMEVLDAHDARATDAILLVTSELVTNAIRYGAGDVEVRLDLEGEHVRVEVLDGGHAALIAPERPPPPDAIGGRGLHLVRSVSERWGAGFDPDGRTWVWAELRLPRVFAESS